jgi:hypothetical protein
MMFSTASLPPAGARIDRRSERAKPLSWHPFSHPRERQGRAGAGPLALLLLAAFGAACRYGSEVRIAHRILENYRGNARIKPLPPSQVIRLRLSATASHEAATGTGEIQWDPRRYRESLSSAGLTVTRGIQGGKAYLTDEDGVTRVASEPVLAELMTRSFFWRRAYLFEDLEKARLELGPSDESSVSIRITPGGGNTLLLTFSRSCDRLLSARAPRFGVVFESPTHFRDVSRPEAPVEAEIGWTGLPTGQMADTEVGGGIARWSPGLAEATLERVGPAVFVAGRICGREARIAIDAAADGPVRVGARLSKRIPVSFQPDVFGRAVAREGTLEIGALSYPSLSLQRSDQLPQGADAQAGALFFRETVVEFDPGQRRVRFHDPARWVSPAGFFRVVLDDDGNRPVAMLNKGRERLRLLAGTACLSALLLAPETASRIGLSPAASVAEGLRWGTVHFDPLPVRIAAQGLDPDWGDEGSLGFEALLQFHAFVDMSHRWAYLRPLEHPAPARLARQSDDLSRAGLSAFQRDRGFAARAEDLRVPGERRSFEEKHRRATGTLDLEGLRRQPVSLVGRAAARHPVSERRAKGHDIVWFHRCSSFRNPLKSADASEGSASESEEPGFLLFRRARAAPPRTRKRPPVASRLAAAARSGFGASDGPGRPETTPPRKIQTTASKSMLLLRSCGTER